MNVAHGTCALVDATSDAESGDWRVGIGLALSHAAGGIAGGLAGLGAASAITAMILPEPPPAVALAAVAAVAAIAITVDFGVLTVPSPKRQINNRWLMRRSPMTAFGGYGMVLGSGLLTYLPYHAIIPILALFVVTNRIGLALAAGSLFGLGRTLMLLPLAAVARSSGGLAAQLGQRRHVVSRASVLLSVSVCSLAAVILAG